MGIRSAARARVLLVEDNPGDAVLARAALEGADHDWVTFDVTVATTLSRAVEQARVEAFDAVLLDLTLPDSRGVATFEEALRVFPSTPIVVLTGLDGDQIAREAIAAGAQDWIAKRDVNQHTLPRAVGWAIERHRRVRDLEAALAERDEANRRLGALAEQQREFVAVASHELRTPVTVIYGLIESFARNPAWTGGEVVDLLLGPMRRQSVRLERLVNDLLTVSRLHRAAITVVPEHLAVRSLVAAALDDSLMGEGDIAVDVPADTVLVADPEVLERVLVNLLDNAVKYGAEPYRLAVRTDGDVVVIEVEDHGGGVPPEFVSHLFDAFAQAQPSGTRTVGGTGLGLSIVNGLVTASGGSVHHEAVEPHGARMVVRLPRSGPVGLEQASAL